MFEKKNTLKMTITKRSENWLDATFESDDEFWTLMGTEMEICQHLMEFMGQLKTKDQLEGE